MSFASLAELKALIAVEKKRTDLARKRKYAALVRTYARLRTKKNGNSGRFWDEKFTTDARRADINYSERDRNMTAYRWLEDLLSPGKRVLNVGCGDGKFESYFSMNALKGVAYEGIDFAAKSIKALNTTYPHFSFRVADVLTEKFTHLFDVICIFEVLEHISSEHVFAVLRKLAKSTQKGGYMMVAVPVNEPLVEMYPANPNEHVRWYAKDTICAELEIVGYDVVKVQEFFAFSKFYTLKKLLSHTLFKDRWKPNDLLILAKKR